MKIDVLVATWRGSEIDVPKLETLTNISWNVLPSRCGTRPDQVSATVDFGDLIESLSQEFDCMILNREKFKLIWINPKGVKFTQS